MNLRAAALQFFAAPFDLTRNLDMVERLTRQAVAQGAQIVVLPELFNTGYVYTPRLFAFAETEDGLTLRRLVRLSGELKVHLAGPLLLREGKQIFNVFALVEPGGKIHKYCKRHPFLWERCYFEAGREPLIASAPPRFHRAVLNFPLGKKVYLAQLMPALLRDREAIDRWYFEDVAERAAWIGAPVVHAIMAGRFVTEVPFPRASFLAAALSRPQYLSLFTEAHLASLRATFYGTSGIFDPQGETLARVEGEEGIAVADVSPGNVREPASPPARNSSAYLLPKVPAQLRVMNWLMQGVGAGYYWRQNRH